MTYMPKDMICKKALCVWNLIWLKIIYFTKYSTMNPDAKSQLIIVYMNGIYPRFVGSILNNTSSSNIFPTLQNIIRIVRPFLAVVSINMLTPSCLYRPKLPDYFGDIFLKKKSIFREYLRWKCWSKSNPQLSFKYFVNLRLIPKFISNVSEVQTTLVK